MILGIGIDQCEIPRIQRQLDAPANGFIDSVFLPPEISYCTTKHNPAQHFAARFAAKEATIKALATAAGQGTFWHDIEITRDPDGRPSILLTGRLRDLADTINLHTIHVSLTHTANLASAIVIAETAPNPTAAHPLRRKP